MSHPDLPITDSTPWLAPMAGLTDLPFRLLCRKLGCYVACTEMISAKGLVYNSPQTYKLLATCDQDTPLVVQLFGAAPGCLQEAIGILLDKGFVYFDLNAGCPVKKVVRSGSGAALLQDKANLLSILESMLAVAGRGKVGVKIRSSWANEHLLDRDFIQELNALGLGWITLHPRSARQGLSGTAKWDQIRRLQELVQIPVIASGDLLSAQAALDCFRQTRASCVMFARGALKNPLIFRDFQGILTANAPQSAALRQMKGQAPISDLGESALQIENPAQVARMHVQLCWKYADNHSSFLKMRTFLPRYLRGATQAKMIRSRVASCSTWEELLKLIDSFEAEFASKN